MAIYSAALEIKTKKQQQNQSHRSFQDTSTAFHTLLFPIYSSPSPRQSFSLLNVSPVRQGF